jgi:hypothetical protein
MSRISCSASNWFQLSAIWASTKRSIRDALDGLAALVVRLEAHQLVLERALSAPRRKVNGS